MMALMYCLSCYLQMTWGAWGTKCSWALHQAVACLRGRYCNVDSSYHFLRFNLSYTTVLLMNLKLLISAFCIKHTCTHTHTHVHRCVHIIRTCAHTCFCPESVKQTNILFLLSWIVFQCLLVFYKVDFKNLAEKIKPIGKKASFQSSQCQLKGSFWCKCHISTNFVTKNFKIRSNYLQ